MTLDSYNIANILVWLSFNNPHAIIEPVLFKHGIRLMAIEYRILVDPATKRRIEQNEKCCGVNAFVVADIVLRDDKNERIVFCECKKTGFGHITTPNNISNLKQAVGYLASLSRSNQETIPEICMEKNWTKELCYAVSSDCHAMKMTLDILTNNVGEILVPLSPENSTLNILYQDNHLYVKFDGFQPFEDNQMLKINSQPLVDYLPLHIIPYSKIPDGETNQKIFREKVKSKLVSTIIRMIGDRKSEIAFADFVASLYNENIYATIGDIDFKKQVRGVIFEIASKIVTAINKKDIINISINKTRISICDVDDYNKEDIILLLQHLKTKAFKNDSLYGQNMDQLSIDNIAAET